MGAEARSTADQAHACAVSMWEQVSTGGPRPRREDFSHLNEVPSPPTMQPTLPPVDPGAVEAALAQMQASPDGQIARRR